MKIEKYLQNITTQPLIRETVLPAGALLLPGKPGVLLDFYIYLMLRRLCNVDTQLLLRLVHVQLELLLSILLARRYESCKLRILLN